MFKVFISACRGKDTDAADTVTLRQSLDCYGLPSVTVDGVYAGKHEASYLVVLTGDDKEYKLIQVLGLADYYHQDCVLVVDDEHGLFAFMRPTESVTAIHWQLGKLVKVARRDAHAIIGDYSVIGGMLYQLHEGV